MKGMFLSMLSILLLVVLPLCGSNRLNQEAFAQDMSREGPVRNAKKQVVLMVCETWLTKSPVMEVLASSSSEGAPDIPLGIECAEAIASVLNVGFRMQNITDIYGLRVQIT